MIRSIYISGSFGQYAQFLPQLNDCFTFSPFIFVYSGSGLVNIVITDTPEFDFPLFLREYLTNDLFSIILVYYNIKYYFTVNIIKKIV